MHPSKLLIRDVLHARKRVVTVRCSAARYCFSVRQSPNLLWQCRRKGALYESVGKSLLVGRVGEACEIARAYLFLMQEGYGTGQTPVLDGGAVLV